VQGSPIAARTWLRPLGRTPRRVVCPTASLRHCREPNQVAFRWLQSCSPGVRLRGRLPYLGSLLNKRFGCTGLLIQNRASPHDRPPCIVSRFHLLKADVRLMFRSFSMKRPYMTGADVPSDHLPTGTINTSIGCAPLNCGISITGDFGKSAPQTFPSRGGV
jgi:hypothetical protein